MRVSLVSAGVLAIASAGTAWAQVPATPAKAPVMPQVCTSCHRPSPGEIRGVFESVALKSGSIQLKIDAATEVVRFDPATLAVVDAGTPRRADALRDITKGREARIEFVEQDGVKTARLVSFKGPITVAPDKLIGYDEVARLVALGPEKGHYTLIDSRPLPRLQEGTIPTAINLPYPAFDKFVDRLPQDKERLTIFFCQGVTCMMSPSSLRRAEAMGYTHARVYREGYPEWLAKNVGVIAAVHLKEAWIDKDLPHVLVDARPRATAREAFIAGAVSVPPSAVRASLATLPDPKLNAPIIVYDVDGGTTARTVAQVIKEAGQTNVTMLAGGIDAWKRAGLPVMTGEPQTRVAYAPKPRPGSVPAEEFVRVVRTASPGVLIVDVRNADEARGGMIRGAVLMPEQEIAARMAELPKGKRIITHCASGVRAEMAYHRLKQAGYDVAFLNADVDIAKNGTFKVTAH